ncbi:MAG: hypothetical protein ACPGGK_02760 [Pikeienuella sp.]
MIERSGYVLTDEDALALEDIVVNVVTNAMSEIELVDWFKSRLVRSTN